MSQVQPRYPVKTGPFSSHRTLVRVVGEMSGGRLLDVGCAEGELSVSFLNAGWAVDAVEPDERDANVALQRGINVFVGSLADAAGSFADEYDCIVAADVLEHMADPLHAVGSLRDMLSRDGRLVVSLPNIAHLAIRAQLASGRFDYQDRGPLDRTHLRFFTRRTAIELLTSAGLRIDRVEVCPAPLELLEPALRGHQVPDGLHTLHHRLARLWPGGLAYQFVIVARSA